MKRAGGAPLRRTSAWSDFARGRCLRELLDRRRRPPGSEEEEAEAPSRLLASPDGQHLLLLWSAPGAQARLATFQRLGAAGAPGAGAPGADLERTWPPRPPVAGLLFLESSSCPAAAAAAATVSWWVLAVVWESGRTELWRFVPAAGWQMLQSLELCHGARARVVSICSWSGQLVWCEERPSLDAHQTPDKRAFQYCVCTRGLQVGEQGAHLSPLRIILHNSPVYRVLASPAAVFLVPTPATFPGVAKFVLVWRPGKADIVLAAPSRGCLYTKISHSGGKVDFKKLVLSYVGLLGSMDLLDVHGCALSSCGGLLLATQAGTVELVQADGVWRPIFDLRQGALDSGEQVQLKVFGDTLACLLGGTLFLVDLNSGQLIEKKVLSIREVVFLDSHVGKQQEEEEEVQLLAPDGIYRLDFSVADNDSKPEADLVEMVFEEACKYYQRRSLSSSQLTVEKLKKGEMFQAPIVLSSVLCHHLSHKEKKPRTLAEPYAKLLSTLQLELQSYQNLEQLKSCVVGASESEVEGYGEALVEQELSRLLHLDLSRENLAYLNAIFTSFPEAFWKATQNHLQLHQNGDGLLVARATPDVWKKILGGPVTSMSRLEGGGLVNGVVPLFELVCISLYQFKSKWLPQFVELSQEYVGSSWTYNNKEGVEGGMPLYKRALAVLPRRRTGSMTDGEMEIELLLSSQRPKAILQALDLLIQHGRWQRVMEAAEKFSRLSPLLNKEIFVILLVEFSKHRALDPYLDKLWVLCPTDLSASDILNVIQQHLDPAESDPSPFLPDGSSQLTVGLLKPLLHRLTQCPSDQSEIYADILQSPTFPPPTPPRHPQVVPKGDSQEKTTPIQSDPGSVVHMR